MLMMTKLIMVRLLFPVIEAKNVAPMIAPRWRIDGVG